MQFPLRNKTDSAQKEKQACWDELVKQLKQVEVEIKANENLFNLATDDDLIDSCIYESQALNRRYCYYMKLVREYSMGLAPEDASASKVATPEADSVAAF